MLKAGDKARDFNVKSDEGKDVALSDFRGKRVLLFFFPKANTSG
jgi:thioredoxin-dependent peroxiredoxin